MNMMTKWEMFLTYDQFMIESACTKDFNGQSITFLTKITYKGSQTSRTA